MDWSQRINRSLLELSEAHSASRIRTDEYRRCRRELLAEAALAARRYASEADGRLQMSARRDRAGRAPAQHASASKTKAVLAVMLCLLLAAVAGGAMFLWLRLA